MATRPEYITVGRFGRVRGVSGEIYISPATDDPARFGDLSEIFVVDAAGKRTKHRLEKVSIISGRPVAKVAGFDSREEAAELTNCSIEIPIEQAQPLPEGRYYQFDLVGCHVQGSDGVEYGIVEEVLFFPANDVYRVVSDSFGSVLFPAVDKFIEKIDIAEKKIIIRPPAGLFESK